MAKGGDSHKAAKARGAEIAAAIEALAKRTGELQSDARARLQRAVKELQAQQKTLDKRIDRLRESGAKAWADGRRDTEKAWTELETLVSETARKFDAERELYSARAAAQFKEWQEAFDAYANKTTSAVDNSRADFERMVADLKVRQQDAQVRVRDVSTAGVKAWRKMSKGFEKAWAEIEKAGKAATAEFEKAEGRREATKAKRTVKKAKPAAKTRAKAGSRAKRAAKPGAGRPAKTKAAPTARRKSAPKPKGGSPAA